MMLRSALGSDNLSIVPASVIKDFHQHHAGMTALIQALQRHHFWPTLKQDVTAGSAAATTCGKCGP